MLDKTIKNIKLVEVADTWQGEGPDSGRQMLIARFKYCNLKCSFCDTQIKMRTSAEGSYSIEDMNKALARTKGLMITGGEPTLETKDIHNLTGTTDMIIGCWNDYQVVNVETNGYNLVDLLYNIRKDINVPEKKIKIMYSPKIFKEQDLATFRQIMELCINDSMVYMKFVADKTELTEQAIAMAAGYVYDKNKIYLMPLGITRSEIDSNWEYCIDTADKYSLNLTSRLHIVHQFT